MLLEQLQLLLLLYIRPVRAASRIIDHGRIWFAVVVAFLALALAPSRVILPRFDHPLAQIILVAIQPISSLRILAAIALAYVPAAILAMTVYRWHETFAVILRKDYLTLLNCVLLSVAAAFLPLVLVTRIVFLGKFATLVLEIAAEIYFLVLAACSIRTLYGCGRAMAGLATLIGIAAMFGGMIAFLFLGPLMYYVASPFLLYYAYILLGSDMRSLGEGLRARQHLRQQLDIATTNPRDADAQYQLGLIYQQRRQYDEAKRRFARAAEIDAREADPVFQLGRIALEEDRLDAAIELLSRAAALDDKCCSHEVWRDLGVAHFRSGRLEDARAALGKFVERRSYDPEGLYWYGKSLLSVGNVDDARQQFEQCREAVETMPKNRRRQLAKWKRLAVAELRGL
jgi:tetratricopeptide (TPR) repeat protein